MNETAFERERRGETDALRLALGYRHDAEEFERLAGDSHYPQDSRALFGRAVRALEIARHNESARASECEKSIWKRLKRYGIQRPDE